MSPLGIKIFLHYACCRSAYDGIEYGSPAFKSEMAFLIDHHLLTAEAIEVDGADHNLKMTARGEVYFTALTTIPLPVQTWIIP